MPFRIAPANQLSHLIALFLFTSSLALPIKADPIPEPWQSKREAVISITDKACEGDNRHITQVLTQLEEKDPVMMNATEWLRTSCDPFKGLTPEETSAYQMKSALAGYPIGMSNYGYILITGDRGNEKDPSTGIALMERAIEAGYGDAAVSLARFHAKGEHVPQDLERARELLEIAEAENVSPEKLKDLRDLIDEVEAEDAPEVSRNDDDPDGAETDADRGDVPVVKGAASLIKEEVGEIIHESEAYSATYGPNGRYVLVGSADRRARLFDIASGAEIREFHGDRRDLNWGRAVTAVAFSPDGRMVLTGDPDNIIRLWDTESGQELQQFVGHDLSSGSVAFSPDGQTMISGSADGTLRMWDVKTGREIRKLLELEGSSADKYVNTVEFSRDGRRILSGNGDGTIRILEAENGRELRRFEADERYTNPAAFSPDGRYVVAGSRNKIRFWNAQTGEKVREIHVGGSVKSVDFGPEGKMALFGTSRYDSGVYITDMEGKVHEDPDQLNFWGDEEDRDVISVAFAPDGETALSIMQGEKITFWGPDPD